VAKEHMVNHMKERALYSSCDKEQSKETSLSMDWPKLIKKKNVLKK